MAYATTSVFDVLADDENQERVGARKALGLAHIRIENHLGRFLRGAVTMEEFDARMATVQDQFAAYVAEACSETGHDGAEHIAHALVDHYSVQRRWQPREMIAGENPFAKKDEKEKDDDEDGDDKDEKDSKPPWLKDKKSEWIDANDPEKESDDEDEDKGDDDRERDEQAIEKQDKKSRFLVSGEYFPYDQQEGRDPGYADAYTPEYEGDAGSGCPTCGGEGQHMGTLGHRDHFRCRNCGMDFSQSQGDQQYRDPGNDSGLPPEYSHMGADNASKLVTCPECGGDGRQAGVNKIGKCHGKGKVPNFGDSMLDAISKTAEDQKNTGLDGPEPKMDKKKWTPHSLDQEPSVDDGGRWPTKRKDPVEIIKAENREDEGHDQEEMSNFTTTETLPSHSTMLGSAR